MLVRLDLPAFREPEEDAEVFLAPEREEWRVPRGRYDRKAYKHMGKVFHYKRRCST
jgi:hypothetical protein